MFAYRIMAPMGVAAVVFLVLAAKVDEKYAYGIVPFLVGIAIVYFLQSELNWWWYNRNPPEMDPKLRSLLERLHPFYRTLSADQKKQFCQKVELFRMGTDWDAVAWPDDMELPDDIPFILASQAVILNFNQPKLLFDKFEKVVVYPKPFPTEQYQFAHASELYEPDGCLLFSAEQLMAAFTQPTHWYNVGLHEYAKAFVISHPEIIFPEMADVTETWALLEQVSGMPRKHVESVIGIAGVAPLPVAIHHYFNFQERFRVALPEQARAFKEIFGF